MFRAFLFGSSNNTMLDASNLIWSVKLALVCQLKVHQCHLHIVKMQSKHETSEWQVNRFDSQRTDLNAGAAFDQSCFGFV